MNPLIQNRSGESRFELMSRSLTAEGFWSLCKIFPDFYIKWIENYRETGLQEDCLSVAQHDSKANFKDKFVV